MTENELIADGWKPEICRIDTLYFKDGFFCRIREEEDEKDVAVFSEANDMTVLGFAKTIEEINEFKRLYYLNQIKDLEEKLKLAKEIYFEKYGTRS